MDRIIVTDKFMEIYQNFNVVPQIEKMLELSRDELLLLLIVTFRTYNYTDVVMKTFKYFEVELNYIDSVMFDSKITDPGKLKMREIILEKYLDIDRIYDSNENPLPRATSEEEAINIRRSLNLNNILNS
jgi:hypothetical protein